MTAPTGVGSYYTVLMESTIRLEQHLQCSSWSLNVTVQDAGGCTSAGTPLTVNTAATPAAPTASVTVQPTCATPTGTIVVTAPLGAGLTYSIDGINYQAATTFTNVAPGPYNVTVQDAVAMYFCANSTHR